MTKSAVALLLIAPVSGWKHFGHNDVNRVDWDVVPPKAVADMTIDHAKALERCSRLSAQHVSHMPASVWAELNAQCFNSLSVAAFKGVTAGELSVFPVCCPAERAA